MSANIWRRNNSRIELMGMRCCTVLTVLCISAVVSAQTTEWRSYGADVEGTKYSPLEQINAENFRDLEVVWRQSVLPDVVRGD